jgi:ribosomal-protein-alanine N-acetyltransferase
VQLFAALFSAVRLDVSGTGAGLQSSSSCATNLAALFFPSFVTNNCSPYLLASRAFFLKERRPPDRATPFNRRFGNRRSLIEAREITMIVLQTPRLILRSFSDGDLDEMSALMANAAFMRFSLGVFSREQTAGFLEKVRARDRDGLPSQFGVVFRHDNRLIGYCGFFLQIVDDVEELEIGYRIHPDYWGQGIATEAARAVRDHGFDHLKLPRLISLIHPANLASRRVAEKNGMTPEKETVFRGFPTIVFSISQEV